MRWYGCIISVHLHSTHSLRNILRAECVENSNFDSTIDITSGFVFFFNLIISNWGLYETIDFRSRYITKSVVSLGFARYIESFSRGDIFWCWGKVLHRSIIYITSRVYITQVNHHYRVCELLYPRELDRRFLIWQSKPVGYKLESRDSILSSDIRAQSS